MEKFVYYSVTLDLNTVHNIIDSFEMRLKALRENTSQRTLTYKLVKYLNKRNGKAS
jgi:hypothetical protein